MKISQNTPLTPLKGGIRFWKYGRYFLKLGELLSSRMIVPLSLPDGQAGGLQGCALSKYEKEL